MSQSIKKQKPKPTMADKILTELQNLNINIRVLNMETSRIARLEEVNLMCLKLIMDTQGTGAKACDKYKDFIERKMLQVLQTDYNFSWKGKDWNK